MKTTIANQQQSLSQSVKQALVNYFKHLEGQIPVDLYQMVIEEVERPLFEQVMQFTHGNQTKAAELLGISRITLRKKIKLYGIE